MNYLAKYSISLAQLLKSSVESSFLLINWTDRTYCASKRNAFPFFMLNTSNGNDKPRSARTIGAACYRLRSHLRPVSVRQELEDPIPVCPHVPAAQPFSKAIIAPDDHPPRQITPEGWCCSKAITYEAIASMSPSGIRRNVTDYLYAETPGASCTR